MIVARFDFVEIERLELPGFARVLQGVLGWLEEQDDHGNMVIDTPLDVLKNAPPPIGSRNQYWKLRVVPM